MSLVNAGVAAVLLRAAAAKIVGPAVAASALQELAGGRLRPPDGVVRLVALLELATLVLLVSPTARPVGYGAVAVLGLSFAALGAAGRLRGSDRPCGCFGVDNDKPLGAANMITGLAFAAVALVGLLATPDAGSAATAATLTSAVSSGWLLVTHRAAAATAYRSFLRRWGSA
ncbi:MauE/DoxX family redox-associated membrane protein [Streptomyces sp. NPDC093586]|uniref:MauE/DoxX family redox-associated membrane protein n=1 Tax=Streptomyces sp. NPDC093586 TaxID=3366042 RepID=UPI00382ACF32